MSRGRNSIFTFRCPEVGLEFSSLGVHWFDYHFRFSMSRGCFSVFTFRCPEVRLEYSLLGVQRSVSISASRGCSTASRGDLQDLGMSRSGVFAIRVGYEGEGGTATRELPLKERKPDNNESQL